MSIDNRCGVVTHVAHDEPSLSNNAERADRASVTLLYYAEVQGDREVDQHTLMVDLLTDLMHLAASEPDLDFDRALRMAGVHFDAEQADG